MKLRMFAAATAALGLMSIATAADAAVTVSARVANELFSATGMNIIEDFDGGTAPNVLYTGHIQTTIEVPVSTSSPPPYTGPGSVTACCSSTGNFQADPTDYASVQMGQEATLELLNGHFLKSFSFYMGSPDSYNHLVMHFVGGGSQAFDGDQIWGGDVLGDGDRTKGFRVYYNFNGAKVNKITFSTENTNAFEFDGLAGNVPEPATWALMIGGFGAAGAMLRRRRCAIA